MRHLKLLFFLLFNLLFSIKSNAQSTLTINCSIFSCQENLDSMNITCENLVTNKIFDVKGKRNKSAQSDSITRVSMIYEIVLLLQSKYKVTFVQKGCRSLSLYFDTELPKTEEGEYGLRFNLNLKTLNDSFDTTLKNVQGILYRYESRTRDFDYVKNANSLIAEMLYNIGVEKMVKNEFSDAMADYDEALLFNPENINALYNRGVIKLKLKDNLGACHDWNAIKQSGNSDADKLLLQFCK